MISLYWASRNCCHAMWPVISHYIYQSGQMWLSCSSSCTEAYNYKVINQVYFDSNVNLDHRCGCRGLILSDSRIIIWTFSGILSTCMWKKIPHMRQKAVERVELNAQIMLLLHTLLGQKIQQLKNRVQSLLAWVVEFNISLQTDKVKM